MGELKHRSLITAQERLRDQVAHQLRAALIAGELRPGSVYSAPGLAADFGVSATPVREAMLDLAREGLVEPVRNKGFRITEVSERDLDQYTEIRALIEIPIVGRVTRTADPAQLEALRPAAAGDRRAPPARTTSSATWRPTAASTSSCSASAATTASSRPSATCASAPVSTASPASTSATSCCPPPRNTSSSST